MRFLWISAVITSSILVLSFLKKPVEADTWIRINLLGYGEESVKGAVWCSKSNNSIKSFRLIDAVTNKPVYKGNAGIPFGAYGPFVQTYRLNFSDFRKPGTYYVEAGDTRSPAFKIGSEVYSGTADFCLRYMRQQRTGYNPFLKDSCHTRDGYTVYGPMKDSTFVDVVGGWHDASDYLQYATTSANATYHLLMAYRDFPKVFGDEKLANGLDGKNETADVLDEAKWGLDWLLKMHPRPDWMFNQIADDRDHNGMRLPKLDSFYNKGAERPVYFINGEPQGLFRYKNRTLGTSSTAAKLSSAFSLASVLLNEEFQPAYAKRDTQRLQRFHKNFPAAFIRKLNDRAYSAYEFATRKFGVTQTAPGNAPYFYEEDNWTDDMELAAIMLHQKLQTESTWSKDDNQYKNFAITLSQQEPVTPWLGKDTAKHYQWYPFINLGHYELAKQLQGKERDLIIGYYRDGINKVWNKAKANSFYRGIPFIWCSNNLTVSFAIQCYWYRKLTGDRSFEELEQACFDWLFGLNPWGTSMVYGLPSEGDTPVDPHSAFTHIGKYPIDGGLVDGPVYGSIFNNLKGLKLYNEDEYAPFQSTLAVYHDDYGDYSTNEPTMDGTASLIYLLAAREAEIKKFMPLPGASRISAEPSSVATPLKKN